MNKIQIIVDSVLGAAVIALFVLHFVGKSDKPANQEDQQTPEKNETVTYAAPVEGQLPIAYVNLDSVLANYQFAVDANDKLMSQQEDARLKLNTKAKTIQKEADDFQRKLNNNAFLSEERAQQEYQKIMKKQQELEQLEAKLTNEILLQNQQLNIQFIDTINNFLKSYNADNRYRIIFSNTAQDNILMAQDEYDITEEVVNSLNARYKK